VKQKKERIYLKNILTREKFKLLEFLVREYKRDNPDISYNELLYVGGIGLLKAATTFDSVEERNFEIHTAYCVKKEISSWLRNNK